MSASIPCHFHLSRVDLRRVKEILRFISNIFLCLQVPLDNRTISKLKVSLRKYTPRNCRLGMASNHLGRFSGCTRSPLGSASLTSGTNLRSITMHNGSLRHSLLSSVCLSLFVGLATLGWAQKDTGSIVGTVKDPSGAVLPNAQVTVKDVERGTTFVTHTNESGEFVASALKIGRYTVTVEHPGFKKAISVPVDLDVQQRIAVNISLEV